MGTKYIYNRKNWPHFNWDAEEINSRLTELRHKQGLLLGKMKSLGFNLQNEATLESLTTEIMTTNAIEGNNLDNKEVRSSLARRLGINVAGVVPVSRAVEGIVEVMLDATQNFSEELTKERLFAWHSALFPAGHSGMQKIAVGKWRTDEHGPMQVVSGPIGKEEVHYEAPSAICVEGEMNEFIKWFNNQDNDTNIILKSAIAHFWFVTVHPFEDGNGRIGRAIAEMVLAQADNSKYRFYSMSEQIEKSRPDYYNHLKASQKGGLDITSWLLWFLLKLNIAFDESKDLLDNVLRKDAIWKSIDGSKINNRQRKIINLMLDNFSGHLTTSKYAKIAKCSQDTALRDIQNLISIGVLKQGEGGGRSTVYVLT